MADLPKKTIQAWRNFAATVPFDEGLTHLMVEYSPQIQGKTAEEMLRCACEFAGYMKAIKDVRDRLTFIQEAPESMDDPPMMQGFTR